MFRYLGWAWCGWVLSASLNLFAADPVPSVSARYAKPEAAETPSFQKHVLPLLGRLGCNGRACHGSFQGQGGFRLSLFGYDFKSDHTALVGGETPRVNRKELADSALLQKPTQTVAHKGGKRFEVGSWQHHLLLRWLQTGAKSVQEGDPEFVSLEVEPGEKVLHKPGETFPLRVIAHWTDRSQEDVTSLCRFRSNDEAVATVSETGVVTAVGKGDTSIIVFYDNGVAAVSVLMPVSDQVGVNYPKIPATTKIDELVNAKLQKLGIVPADRCNDADFLRRVSLDMTGSLPRADEVLAFLADKATDKRAKKIDELLQRPTYAAWWATRLCDFTGNSEANGPLGGEQGLRREQAKQWYQWIFRRVQENVGYDQIVAGLVLAVSRPQEQTFEKFCAEMSSYYRKTDPADFAKRATMPFYWTRKDLSPPKEKGLSFAHAFLGVQLQCAECHKHPYDQWTKQDFDQFTAFFNGIRYGAGNRVLTAEMKVEFGLHKLDEDSGTYKRKFVDLLGEGKVLPFKELTVPLGVKGKPVKQAAGPGGRVITPKLLGGEEVIASNYVDPRQPLMDWLRDENNPYFARAFVNRVWSGYFNVGLIEPVDDMNLANPPSNKALLDYLAKEFVAQKYDMRWLHRTIVSSDTYQRSWQTNATNRLDDKNYSRAVLRRLPAEVTYDALVLATAGQESLKTLHQEPVSTRAIGWQSCFSSTREPGNYAANLFGKPARTINCDCERSSEPTLLQTVFLRNDQEVLALLDRKEGWLKQLTSVSAVPVKGKAKEGAVPAEASAPRKLTAEDDTLIREAFVRTLGRLPSESDLAIGRTQLQSAPDTVAGLRDLLWALLNTKEFILNR